MLCTSCSRPVRPVVALDIDGTLGDYHGHLLEFAEGYFGRSTHPDLDPYNGGVNFGGWVCAAFEIERHEYREMKLAYRQGGLKRTMPTRMGAALLAADLWAENVEVWIATSRAYNRLDSIDPDTKEWLDRNGIKYDHIIYGDDKYIQLRHQVGKERVVAVLDDLGEQYDRAALVFGSDVPLLLKSRWNDSVSRPHEADSLFPAQKEIQRRLEAWLHTYERAI